MNENIQVLMSTYNGEKYLRNQIDSILSQENVNVSILVRDDGSEDGTLKILEDYESKGQIKLIKGQNCGFIRSFLELIDSSDKSDFYAYADQDDVWMSDKLISGIERLKKEDTSKPLLYCTSLQRVNEDLKPLSVQSYPKLKLSIYSQLVRERLAGCTFVLNKNLRDMLYGSSKLDLEYSHDSWTVLTCWATGGKVVFDNSPHILFRRYGTNTSVDGGGLKKRIKHELRYFGKCRNQRFKTVKKLLDFRADKIEGDNKVILKSIRDYKTSTRATFRLAFNTKLDCGIKMSNFITRIVILFRCF